MHLPDLIGLLAALASDPSPWQVLQALGVAMVLVAGGVITVAGALAVIWKFAKPWLQRELFEPVQETHKQVTVNGGKNDPPTIPDLLGNVATKGDVDTVRDLANGIRDDLNNHLLQASAADRRRDEHLERLDDSLSTLAESQKAVWPAIEAVAKARPPEESDEPSPDIPDRR